MKKYIAPSLKLTLLMIVLCSAIYPLLIAGISKAADGKGGGAKALVNGKIVGYANVGQKFTEDKYFWGRPSAVDYNAAGSGGSNKGPSNPDYLRTLEDRVDIFLVHNPAVKRSEIPTEMITASGSGLDPDISPRSALIQVKRIAAIRKIDEAVLNSLIQKNTQAALAGFLGPVKINVLKLNIALDQINNQN
jgi:K+-transporting ATPase ATPase C chain